jgi:hypothetical protein
VKMQAMQKPPKKAIKGKNTISKGSKGKKR